MSSSLSPAVPRRRRPVGGAGAAGRVAAAALFAACLFAPQSPAPAAFAGPVNAATAADLHDAVEDGRNLERARKWGDAIRHYSDALDRFAPDHQAADAEPLTGNALSLQYGLRRSKIHYGIVRRYADPSFTDDLLARPPTTALSLYGEVLSQVRRNYVEPIGATSLVAHGTESLYLALSNRHFLKANLPGHGSERTAAAVERYRAVLRDEFWNASVREGGETARVERAARLGRDLCGLTETAVVLEYLSGATNALDDYSTFLTPHKLSDLYGNINGNFVGIGIEIEAEGGRGQFLRRILPGSPAEEGGAKPGEYISAIAGHDCRDLTTDQAAKLLRGPEHSEVELELTGAGGAVRRGRFRRRTVEVSSVEAAEMVAPAEGIGYIRMGGFQETTAREMREALTKLRGQGMTKLIFDLRGNPGGLLDAAVDTLDLFVDSGVLVGTRGPARDQTQTYTARPFDTLTDRDLKIALLVDGDSASASEIVAGCFRDHRRATIVGRTTYGKWSVQSIIDLGRTTRGSGLKLTTARFYSPHGKNYMRIGLDPDVSVPEYGDDGFGEDSDFSPEDLFAAADPAAGTSSDRTTGYRSPRVARKQGPRVPQTSLPLDEQADIRAALGVLRRR